VSKNEEDVQTAKEMAAHLETLLEALVDNTKSTELHLERLANESLSHKEDLQKLMKVVIDGNGQPPMQTRLALLEQSVSSTASEIENIKSRWWQIVMMVLPGILGSVLGISAVM
tara:strand:+ start:11922 stop:12263 length:342 start_codon:yes stop_codon:yes gene_type:complete